MLLIISTIIENFYNISINEFPSMDICIYVSIYSLWEGMGDIKNRLINIVKMVLDRIEQGINMPIEKSCGSIDDILGVQSDKFGISFDIEHFKDFDDKDELNKEVLDLVEKFLQGSNEKE